VCDILNRRYGVPHGIKAQDWVAKYHHLQKEHDEKPFAKTFMIHGYGIKYEDENVSIDFDFSERGISNGFDEWRIFVYLCYDSPHILDKNNYLKLSLESIKTSIERWFAQLVTNKIIVKHGNLYHLCEQLSKNENF